MNKSITTLLLFALLHTLAGCYREEQISIELETTTFNLSVPELEGRLKPEKSITEDVERYSKRFRNGLTKRIDVIYKKDSTAYIDWIDFWSLERMMTHEDDCDMDPYTIEIIKIYGFNEGVWEESKVTFIREDTTRYDGEVIYLRRLFSKEAELTLEIVNAMKHFDYVECVQYFEKYKGVVLKFK